MDDDSVPNAVEEATDDEQVGRFCDAFVSDFDGTSALLLSALEKDTEAPTTILETLTEITRQAESWLPAEMCDHFTTELIPHVVQIVLSKSEEAAMDAESVERVAVFLETVLERVVHRLLMCDACLLPTLVRMLDDQRSFYGIRMGNVTEDEDTHGEGSPLYLRIISHWAAVDGFTILLRCLQASSARTESSGDGEEQEAKGPEEQDDAVSETVFSFDAIQCIYRAVYAIKDHVSHSFLKQYAGLLAQSSRIYVTSMTNNEFASVPRDKLLELVHIVELVVAQVSSDGAEEQDEPDLVVEEAELCVQLLQLDLMLRFFTSSSLEKRIYGLTEIIDVLNKAPARHVEFYVKWIADNQIADLLFGEKKHPELIKRALPLPRFLVATQDVLIEWVNAMWVCFAGKTVQATDETSELAHARSSGTQTHEVVRVTVHALLHDVIGFASPELLDHVLGLIKKSSRPLDADNLSLLSSMAKKATSLRTPVLMFLWEKCPTASSTFADQIIDEIVAVLGQTVEDEENDDESLVDVFVRLCVECIESAAASISVSLRLLEKIGSLVREREVRVNVPIAGRLIPAVLSEIDVFEQQFKLISDDIEYSAADSDDHVLGVRERLLALRGCMVIAAVSDVDVLPLSVVDAVWDLCVYKSCYSDEAASLFFQWIEYCFRTKIYTEDGGDCRRLLSEEIAEELILRRFASLKSEAMTMSALTCFHHLLRKINISRGGIMVCNAEGAEIDEDNGTDETVVSDLLTEKAAFGIEELWRFALYAADQAVADEAMTLLARYHMDVVPALVGSDFADKKKREFVAKCTAILCSPESGDTGGNATSVLLVGRCLDCLRYFLDANHSTAKSTEGGLTEAGDQVYTSADSTGGGERLNKFALDHLEQKLQLVDIYPSPMKDTPFSLGANSELGTPTLLSSGPRRPSWNFRQHHAVLEAIVDEGDQDGPLTEQELDSSRTTHGIGEAHLEGSFTERRLSIDTSVPGPLRPTQLTTSPSVQARPDSHWFYAADVASSQEPDFVIEKLETDSSIRGADSIQGESALSVAQLLVNWPKLFDTLFDLVHWDDAGTSQRAWGLLCQLPINAKILKRMLKLRPSSNEDVSWAQLLDADSPHRLLYSLRLVEALLLHCQKKDQGSKWEDKVRRQWRERFLRLGGAKHVKELLSNLGSRIKASPIEYSCIGALARVLAYFARLHYSPSDLVDPKSPFDSRLCTATLPQAFPVEGEPTVSLLSLVADLLRQKWDGRSSGTALCLVDLFCSIAPLNPAVAMGALRSGGSHGVRDLLDCIVSTLETSTARSDGIKMMIDMQSKFNSLSACSEFYEAILKIAFEMSCEGERPDELFSLIVALSPYLPAISSWMIEGSMVSSLLAKMESLINMDRKSSKSSLCSHLQVVAAVASHSGPLQDACLKYQPLADESDTPWILDLLTRRILWSTAENTAGEICDSGIRDAAETAVFALVFQSEARTDTGEGFTLRQLTKFYDIVLARLDVMGRPWNFQPSDELQDISENGAHLAGLVNPGCVCYMNSVMQQLFMMPTFRTGLLSLDSSSSTSEWQFEVAELQKLFVSLATSHRKALDPTSFALSHRDMDGQPTDLNVQMDADEFVCLLLDRIETCVLQSPAAVAANSSDTAGTFLDRCFGGVLVNQILTENGHLSEREEKFFALSLDVSQKQHLPESLSLYVQGETLDGDNAYYCEQVKKKVSATKRVCIKRLPQTLLCHLKRFEFDFDAMQKIKIHDYLAFPEEIDMYPFTSEAFATKQTDDAKALSIMYDLVGIVVHSGSSDMGHYYSFIKDRSTNTNGWFEFNDQTVKPFDVSTMGDECFGGEEVTQKWDHGARAYAPVVQRKKRSAYLLVYERRRAASANQDPTSSSVIDWTATPRAVQEQRKLVLRENLELLHVVNAASREHIRFIQKLAIARLASKMNNEAPEDDDDAELTEMPAQDIQHGDDYAVQVLRAKDTDVRIAVLSCQQLFGISSLLETDDDETIGALVATIENWLNITSGKNADRKLLFCKWLLTQATAASTARRSNRGYMERSWLFDVLIFCEKRLTFVQNCCFLLQQSLLFLVKHGRSSQDQRVAIDFLRFAGELYYERHDVVIEDPASGSRFPIPQSSIVHAVTLLGTFLRDCVNADDTDTVKSWFVVKSGFIERFLFSLQDNEAPRRSGASMMAPITSRERSCTFSLERQLLTDAFGVLPTMSENVLEDPRLLLSHSILKNVVTFEFTEVITPLIVHCVIHQMTRAQCEKFVSLLLAVLEEVKSTHLDQLLHMFGALLDAEDETEDSSALATIHEHILSPSSGLLEAAAYYRDHRTLHEYAFLLVEFVVTRASSSSRVHRYFQHDEAIAGQVEWVKQWLGDYLDPNGAIRRSTEADNEQDENQSDDPTLDTEVRQIFRKAERAFGFAMLQIPTLAEEDDEVVLEDKAFAIESLEDSDGMLFSSDGENQDDDDVDESSKPLGTKRVLHFERRPSLDTKTSRVELKTDRNRPEVDESSSTIVTRAHMSSAA